MGRNSVLFKHMTHVDFEEIRQKGTPAAKGVIDRITATVSGTEFELTEESVAESLRLPTDGQDATSDIELTTFEAACQILSATKEPVKVSGNKASLRPDIGPGVIIPSRRLIRSKHFLERKQPTPGSTGGRKKTTAKKSAPAKEKTGSKGKEKIVFSEPPSQTEEEESASTSERTESEKTDEERPNDEEHSGPSPDNTGTGANPENAEADEEDIEEEEEDDQTKADTIARRILETIALRAEKVGDIYREWHEYRFSKLFKHILPSFTDEECFKRMKEIEDAVMSLTNAETIHDALGRTSIIRPRARLQKLTVRIRKIKEKYVEGTPEANLHLLVLEKLETARGELAEEIDRLEVACSQRQIPHSPAPQTDEGLIHGATPPRGDPVINETDERAEPLLTGQLQHEQPGVSEPGITKEWVKSLLQEFVDSTVHPLEERMKRIVSMALWFAKNTRNKLVMTDDRFIQIDADYREEAVLRDNHLQRTKALEEDTSGLKDDFDRLERETEQRLREVTKDLVGSTLSRVSELEKKNAAVVEANARAAKEVQNAMDEEARLAKEPPQLTEEEIAEHERRAVAKYPGLAESVAAQQREDAERLNNERQRLANFAKANEKKKAASAVSVPAKRKRKSSKKAQVVGLLNEVTDTVIDSQPDQATHTEEEDEEHLERRPTRQRVCEPASQAQPVKRKRNKDLMASFDFSDSE
ncbi:uncharacterized protein LOC124932574 [Impatiens glandulifera]|uniref:uncharacterized protein LOC124932574 n=1 Tax=Impatiens glandulifera TaxID=253017 RepID=UPI001FB0F40D|nr:uncharacterized protein LOC124932574 [Impatiens glandulifera]